MNDEDLEIPDFLNIRKNGTANKRGFRAPPPPWGDTPQRNFVEDYRYRQDDAAQQLQREYDERRRRRQQNRSIARDSSKPPFPNARWDARNARWVQDFIGLRPVALQEKPKEEVAAQKHVKMPKAAKIVMLMEKYPRDPGTKREEQFKFALKSKSVDEFIAKGGDRGELLKFAQWGWLKLEE